ncbi:MAG: 2-oxo acid dehydrogenase subunit E2 [Treponema sp.]|jgi:pyruvate dehydrogenase E2 component (dihydrolipoamide acetyltransferase)|nr:2-oxo acid dehydrogenase subunit E2 [Treponema sp.]
MAHVLIMPRQGNTVESCIIVEWKVKEGDTVSADTAICEVETDKATFEVPAGEQGLVLKLLRAGGEDVPVLEPIAVIGQAGEDWAAALGKADAGSVPVSASPGGEQSAPMPASGGQGPNIAEPAAPSWGQGPNAARMPGERLPVSPRARNLADKEGISPAGIPGSGPGGRIIERDIAAALQSGPALTAAARADLRGNGGAAGGSLPPEGSGLAGRITAGDLAGAGGTGAAKPAAAEKAPPRIPDLGEGGVTETPIKGIRKLIADRMFQSLAESAQFTLNAAAPAVRLQELRARMKGSGESLGLSNITVNDLVLFAVSRTLPRFPFMNAHKIGDTLKTFERVHLGMAVDTPKGLMVPVIRNANLLSLRQISGEAKRLASACQNGGIGPDELSGSTFTVTNLGSLGVSGFTPVLNAPEVGILGVCGIELKPLAGTGGEVSFLPHISFSLTINHQVVDGAPAARFLKALGDTVADIDLWFV